MEETTTRPMPCKRVLVSDESTVGLAGLVQAGPLLFAAGCDGHRPPEANSIAPDLAGNAERQCEIAYARIQGLLRHAGVDLTAVVRLDHATSSQDWLSRRQTIRQRYFGRPAPLASTGVAAKMQGINMLTTSAIAVSDPTIKEVLVAGSIYGMPNISSAVRGGPFVFFSGVRGTLDPRTGERVEEETNESFIAQTRMCYDIIGSMLADIGVSSESILRLDCYVRDINMASVEAAIRTQLLDDAVCASTVVGLPLGARGEVEITALALAPGYRKRMIAPSEDKRQPCIVGAEGFLFVGECRGDASPNERQINSRLIVGKEAQLQNALTVLGERLRLAGSDLSGVVRLDVYLRDIYFASTAHKVLRQRFAQNPPAVSVIGVELEDSLEVKLSAIAVLQ